MAYVEAAAVLYLRTLYGGVDPVGPRHPPFTPLPDFVWIELGREAATMLMLASVAYLSAQTQLARIGAFGIAMGSWDIFYYVFLWLFLIPLPWWGPVLSPVVVATLIVVGGAAVIARELGDGVPRPRGAHLLAIVSGAAICLVAFMSSALLELPHGIEAAYYSRGGPFPWLIF